MRPEIIIENKVRKTALLFGVPSLKMKLDTNAGWPDVLFLMPAGKPAFIEFKAPGETPRKLQWHRIKTLGKLGYDVNWFDDSKKACRWLAAIHAARLSETGHQVNGQTGLRWAPLGSRAW